MSRPSSCTCGVLQWREWDVSNFFLSAHCVAYQRRLVKHISLGKTLGVVMASL
jgi:hypothetical protein